MAQMMVGPYFLVRPLRTRNLRIYEVYEGEEYGRKLATLWRVDAPEYDIPEEWRVRCADCPEPPSPYRRESVSRAYTDRDAALTWLARHRRQHRL